MDSRIPDETEPVNRQFDLLLDKMMNGFAYCKMIYNGNGEPLDIQYLKVNDAFTKLSGLKDVVGKKISEVVPGIRLNHPELFEIYGRVAKSGKSEQFEMYIEQMGAWRAFSVASLGDEHFMVVFDDITVRKENESKLKESEERFRNMLDHSLDAPYCRNVQTDTYDFMGPAMEVMSGYTVQEFMNMSVETFISHIHPEDIERVKKIIEESNAGGKASYKIEYRFKNRAGEYRWFEDLFLFLADTEGKPLCRMGSVRDISESKRMYEELLDSALRYRMLLDNVNEAIFLLEVDWNGKPLKFRDVNDEACRSLGYSREELLELSLFDIIPPSGLESAAKNVHNLMESKSATFESTHQSKDGRLIPVELSVRYFISAGVPYFLGIVHDLTERRQSEDLLQKAYERRIRNDILGEMLKVNVLEKKKILEMTHRLGINPDQAFVCYLLVIDKWEGRSREYWLEHFEALRALQDVVIDGLEENKSFVAWASSEGIGVLHFGIDDKWQERDYQIEVAEQLRKQASKCLPGVAVRIGIAETAEEITELGTRFRQCCSAVDVGSKMWPEQKNIHYLDLGICQIIPYIHEQKQVENFIERTLGRLIRYEKQKRGDYLLTLELILRSGNLTDVAKEAFVHPKTVLLRKKRIEAILGVSLDNYETRLALAAALKLMKFAPPKAETET